MIERLRGYFNELDLDGSKSIGIDELEGPWIGLGVANTREEINAMIYEVDEDGEIEFEEFTQIIKNKGPCDGH